MKDNAGALYLVSVGIGDTDNMTVRAQKTVERADLVLAMPFIQEQLGGMLEGKEVHDPGHALFTESEHNYGSPEEEEKIRTLIRSGVRDGKTVAVLDFGDPTVYGPQSAYLKEFSDLNPKIIPGISSFNAANAALGRELTGTGAFDRAIVLTEAMEEWDGSQERLKQIAASRPTLVIFSMKLDLARVTQDLMDHYPPNTPVAIVTHAGFSGQESIIRGTLKTIVEQTQSKKLPWQHLIYVGDFLTE